MKILSLDLYAFLASSEHARAAVNASSLNYQKGSSLLSAQGSSIMATISRFREVGQPLNQTFVHPTNLPMTVFGIFLSEMEVEAGIKKMENYKYFEELCCVYHIRVCRSMKYLYLYISKIFLEFIRVQTCFCFVSTEWKRTSKLRIEHFQPLRI